jgi:parallel beta-helix repeat protein
MTRGTWRVTVLAAFGLALVAVGPAAAKKKPKAVMPSCGDTLTASVAFTADLDCSGYGGDALTVGANNITIDLKGHTLTGPPGKDGISGIYTAGYNGTKILNGTIAGFSNDVYLYESSDAQISGIAFQGDPADNTDDGVYDYYGSGSRVQKSTFGGDLYYGIYGYYTSGVFTHNAFTTDEYGVETEYDTGDRIGSNTANGVPHAYYDDYSYNQTYSNNIAIGPTDGVYVDCDKYGNTTVVNNTVIDASSYGYYLWECYNKAAWNTWTMVSGNQSLGGPDSSSAYGFYDYYSINATYTGNVSNASDYGFYLEYPSGIRFEANTANTNGYAGIYGSENYYYYNFLDASYNVANANGSYGLYASYGAPGTSNHASGNGWNCEDFSCPGSAAPVFGGSAPAPPPPSDAPPPAPLHG